MGSPDVFGGDPFSSANLVEDRLKEPTISPVQERGSERFPRVNNACFYTGLFLSSGVLPMIGWYTYTQDPIYL